MVSIEEHKKSLEIFLEAEKNFSELVSKYITPSNMGEKGGEVLTISEKDVEEIKIAQIIKEKAKKNLDDLENKKRLAGAWGR